jgi:hypothetical protein
VTTISRFFAEALMICAVCLVSTVSASSQETLDRDAIEKIDHDAVFQLLDKDVGAVIDQLAAEQQTTVAPLLRHLIIYARLGRDEHVRQTLEQLARASDWQSQAGAVYDKIRNGIRAGDLATWRIFYEQLYPRDALDAEAFVTLWERQGDPRELEAWLSARSAASPSGRYEWFRLRVDRLARMGMAGEVMEPLAARVKANPRDLDLIEHYLMVNNWAHELQDTAWLAEACGLGTAYENYELGERLQPRSPQAAARLFLKSLSLPFTERDAHLVQERGFRYLSMGPPRVKWEKQLRFWTKRSLAAAYQTLKRPKDAQPLIEELVAMKRDDIVTQDVHELAGGVQAMSGQRVVEARVLASEAAQQNKSGYWIERASYYRGREEYGLEDDSYHKALTALPYDPKDPKVSAERLKVVDSFVFSLYSNRNERQNWRIEIEKVLRQEFTGVLPDTNYAFQIARLIASNDFELQELRASLFVEQPNLLARLLAPREWENTEQLVISRAVSGDEITPAQREKIWTALEKLINDAGSLRVYHLAEAMIYSGDYQRARPLLLGYFNKGAPNDYIDRSMVLSELVETYCRTGDWRAAEKLLFNHSDLSWRSLPGHLGRIAVTAGKQGEIKDALRLWQLKSKLDRNDLTGLDELSRTEAKSQLRAFYIQMKKEEPLTTAPEAALRVLQQ